MKSKTSAIAFILAAFGASDAFSQTVIDFNSGFSIDTVLNGQAASQPGLAGNWNSATSNTSFVTTGTDLTNAFALDQTGTANRVLTETSTGSAPATIVSYASLDTPQTGTTYFSFLASTTTDGSGDDYVFSSGGVVGIAFNPTSHDVNAEFNIAVVRGAEVRFRDGATARGSASTTVGTNFYVGTIDWDASGDETLKLWINPDTTDSGFLISSPSINISTQNMGSSLTSIGVFSYEDNGVLDNVRIGSSLSDVAVIPEASSFSIIIGCFCALMSFTRRRVAKS